MSVDDELRRRLQAAADRAGAGANAATLTRGARARVGRRRSGRSWRLFAGLGGIALVAVVAGGVLGYTVLAPTAHHTAQIDPGQYGLYDCPNGSVLSMASAGDRVFVTGRDASGGWLRIRDPHDSAGERWVPAGALDADSADAAVDDAVPIVECTPPIQLAPVTIATLPTDSVLDTTTTTIAPDTPPVVGQPSASPAAIYGVAPCNPTSTVLTVQVVGANRINRVRVVWSYPQLNGGLASGTVDLVAAGDTWSGIIAPTSDPPNEDLPMSISITARDVKGRTTTLSAPGLVLVKYCLV